MNMKFLRYRKNNEVHYGILKEDDSNKIIRIEGSPFTSYKKSEKEDELNKVKILTPCDYSKAVCVGLNYRDHAEEFNLPIPKSPILFIKPSTAALALDETILKPKMCERLDFEAELAVIIKKTAHKVKIEDAPEYILGYTCANDVTARDLQPKEGQWTLSKGFDTFCPFGPYITTDIDPTSLNIKSILDGDVKQSSNTKNLIFNVEYLVSYISNIMSLNPGDLILTGTPSGICKMDDGASITVEIEGLGKLTNIIKYEQ